MLDCILWKWGTWYICI